MGGNLKIPQSASLLIRRMLAPRSWWSIREGEDVLRTLPRGAFAKPARDSLRDDASLVAEIACSRVGMLKMKGNSLKWKTWLN